MKLRFATTLLAAAISVGAHAQEQTPFDRFYGQFPIAGAELRTKPVDGGAGGNLRTPPVAIFAQAIVKVFEGQRFEWEWVGLTAPGFTELLNWPNVEFTFNSDEIREYRDLVLDLNPVSPNVWGSADVTSLEYDFISASGTYKSFSHESSFATRLLSRQDLSNPFEFPVTVRTLDYSRFRERLTATIRGDRRTVLLRPEGYFDVPRQEIILEPKLAVDALYVWQFPLLNEETGEPLPFDNGEFTKTFVLRHTPAGDANNDGVVGFADFLLMSSNFGQVAAAKWEDGDFDDDGAVSFSDFLQLSANFGEQARAAVPEPTVSMLLIMGLVVAFLFRPK